MAPLTASNYVCPRCLPRITTSPATLTRQRRIPPSWRERRRQRCYSTAVPASSPSIPSRPFRLAVIGSGPAGFYAASRVMREHNKTVVDMYEKLPVPFGLVRYGVAPDHPEVKNCQDRFEEIASLPNFNFIGNTELGKDIHLDALLPHYDAILFSYGAAHDRTLGIPGKDLQGVFSARSFVAWYNGLPGYEGLNPFSAELAAGRPLNKAVVIGNGNVALDVARILLQDVDELRKTDIPEHVLATLLNNKVRQVDIVGRRGPMQASFTIKEVRELATLPSAALDPTPRHFFPYDTKTIPVRKRRLAELLIDPGRKRKEKTASSTSAARPAQASLRFFLSPTAFLPSHPKHPTSTTTHLNAISLARTQLDVDIEDPEYDALLGAAMADPDARVRTMSGKDPLHIATPLAFRSIGYKATALPGLVDIGVPFDERRGIIPNTAGRVATTASSGEAGPMPKIYVAGWAKRGPTGVIASTMEDAFETAASIVADVRGSGDFSTGAEVGETSSPGASSAGGSFSEADNAVFGGAGGTGAEEKSDGRGWEAVRGALSSGARPVSWRDWRRIDEVEKERGAKLGKPREKIVSVDEMLAVLDG